MVLCYSISCCIVSLFCCSIASKHMTLVCSGIGYVTSSALFYFCYIDINSFSICPAYDCVMIIECKMGSIYKNQPFKLCFQQICDTLVYVHIYSYMHMHSYTSPKQKHKNLYVYVMGSLIPEIFLRTWFNSPFQLLFKG